MSPGCAGPSRRASIYRLEAPKADLHRESGTPVRGSILFDAEQLPGRSAADRFNLVRREAGVFDDGHRLVIANRKWHVGAEHDTVDAHHLDDKSQHARIVL